MVMIKSGRLTEVEVNAKANKANTILSMDLVQSGRLRSDHILFPVTYLQSKEKIKNLKRGGETGTPTKALFGTMAPKSTKAERGATAVMEVWWIFA